MENPNQHPHWAASTMLRIGQEPTLADAALGYANLGVPVFPCVPGGKAPLTSSGFHDASAAMAVVGQWWARTPEANIGLPTGARTGVVVVDIDVHADSSGFGAFERSRRHGLADGWGWLVRTPSGGMHAYYSATPGREQRSWQAASSHIDFRGDGGYVIAPPSRLEIDGTRTPYVALATTEHSARGIDAFALREFLEPPRRQLPPPVSLPAAGTRPDRLAAWLVERPEGERNASLFWASCRMVEGGHEYRNTLTLLGRAARQAGLPDQEIERTVRSAYRVTSRLDPASRPGPTRPGEAISR